MRKTKFICVDCGANTVLSFRATTLVCYPCRRERERKYARERARKYRFQGNASSRVQTAVGKGILKHPRKCKCVDCGKQAQAYDHRYYSRPLDVVPVCRSCNKKRGKALDFDDLARAA